jgi:hypothetical protein
MGEGDIVAENSNSLLSAFTHKFITDRNVSGILTGGRGCISVLWAVPPIVQPTTPLLPHPSLLP